MGITNGLEVWFVMPRAVINPDDIVGERFGKLVVESYVGRVLRGKTLTHCYLCKCDCGKTNVEATRAALLKGDKKSCGCAYKDAGNAVLEDLTGRQFGRWTVLRRAPNRMSPSGKTRSIMWTCKCECGKVKDVRARALKTGMSTSCGCLQKEHVSAALTDDLTGQRFGYLTVTARNGSTSGHRKSGKAAVWRCRCDCGRELDVPGWCLKNGDYTSCGCKNVSKYELYVMQYLESIGYIRDVDYFKEKTFPGLVGVDVGDRWLIENLVKLRSGRPVLIECQGQQHYRPIEWFGGQNKFDRQVANDAKKRDFAKNNGIELIEMPYTNVLYSDVVTFLKDNDVS